MRPLHDYSPDAPAAEFEKLSELIENGFYEEAAEFLERARVSREQNGADTLIELFSVARQICLACGQSRAERAWHLRAQENAGERESELKNQLQALLERLSGGDSGKPRPKSQGPEKGPSPNSKSSNETSGTRRLWGIIQSLPGAWRFAQSPSAQTKSDQSAAAQAGARKAPVRRSSAAASSNLMASGGHLAKGSLRVYCLGPFRVFRDLQMIGNWPSLKGRSVFKYLVEHHHTPISKGVLMEVFWPDTDVENARRNLHQAIYSLRQTLRRGQPDFRPILFERDHYQINPDLKLWLDFEEFERCVKAGRRLETAGKAAEAMAEYGRAQDLYQGDFLEEDLYEDWTGSSRERIRTEYLDLADRLSEQYAQQGDYPAAISLCQQILAKDNCHEETHRRLMRCYQAMGQTSAAARQYQRCVETLKTELDVAPSAETQRLFKNIFGATC